MWRRRDAEVARCNVDRLTNADAPMRTSALWISISEVTVEGPYTIRVHTSRPLATFLT